MDPLLFEINLTDSNNIKQLHHGCWSENYTVYLYKEENSLPLNKYMYQQYFALKHYFQLLLCTTLPYTCVLNIQATCTKLTKSPRGNKMPCTYHRVSHLSSIS